VLDLSPGPIHLSYGPGAGATTLCLSISATVLECGNKVIWITRESLDPERASQVLGKLGEESLLRLTIFRIKDRLANSITSIRTLIERMERDDLLVVDDWCERHGRANPGDIEAIHELVFRKPECGVIITSAYVSSPAPKQGGNIGGLTPRGGRALNELVRVVFLYDDMQKVGHRILNDSGQKSQICLSSSGFSPIYPHSSE